MHRFRYAGDHPGISGISRGIRTFSRESPGSAPPSKNRCGRVMFCAAVFCPLRWASPEAGIETRRYPDGTGAFSPVSRADRHRPTPSAAPPYPKNVHGNLARQAPDVSIFWRENLSVVLSCSIYRKNGEISIRVRKTQGNRTAAGPPYDPKQIIRNGKGLCKRSVATISQRSATASRS